MFPIKLSEETSRQLPKRVRTEEDYTYAVLMTDKQLRALAHLAYLERESRLLASPADYRNFKEYDRGIRMVINEDGSYVLEEF